MRINRYIASSGLCSRRAADKLVEKKEVKINGTLAEKHSVVNEGDVVTVKGKEIN